MSGMQKTERMNNLKTKEFFKYCFGCDPSVMPEVAIVTPFLPVKGFSKYCDTLESFKGRTYSGITASREGVKFAVVRSGMSSQLAGDAAALLADQGVKEILFTGSCGGFGPCKIGDLVIAKRAFDGGSFPQSISKDIFKLERFIASATDYTRELERFLLGKTEDNETLKKGDIFTISSLFLELGDGIREVEKKGFLGVDMELAAVYSACGDANISASSLLFVSDLPLSAPFWEMDPDEEIIEKVIKLSLEFVTDKKIGR